MRIMVMNPAFPKDTTKARTLTSEQFKIVHDDYVAMMNNRHRRTGKASFDAKIVQKLIDHNLPIDFDAPDIDKEYTGSVQLSS